MSIVPRARNPETKKRFLGEAYQVHAADERWNHLPGTDSLILEPMLLLYIYNGETSAGQGNPRIDKPAFPPADSVRSILGPTEMPQQEARCRFLG